MDQEDNDKNFAELFEASAASTREGSFLPGERVKGKVVLVTADTVFIDYGAKSEGWADVDEFKDEKGEISVKPGQEVELNFVGYGPSGAHLGSYLRGGPGGAGVALLRKAFEAGLAVEGTVTGTNKGGLEISISGTKAFCPFSQMDLTYVDKPEAFIGTTQKFMVTQFEEEGRNIVLSRRAVLQAEKEALAQNTRSRLAVGEVFPGRVTRLTPFGAFVDLGGIEGLIHISEISRSQVKDPADFLSLGQEVKVQVLEIKSDEKNEQRISLSMKVLEADPWEKDFGFEEGDVLLGTVRSLTAFGAFVSLAPGLDGLVHISEISSKRIHHPRDVLKEGQEIPVMVLEINREQKRISLSIKEVAPVSEDEMETFREEQVRSGNVIRKRRKAVVLSENDANEIGEYAPESGETGPLSQTQRAGAPLPEVGLIVKGIIRSVKPYGFFIDLPDLGPHQSGLLHVSQTATPEKGISAKGLKEGDELQVQIIKIDEQGRISLSQKSVLDHQDRDELKQYRDRVQESGKLGTMADLFNKKGK
ncbi:MAG: S1 RNA-binding domain-containing protein [Thermodesulfobacteriota bacterium]